MKQKSATSNLDPWQMNDYAKLLELKSRLPGAILFYGDNLLGGEKLVQAWSQSLLCSNPQIDGSACNKCDSCVLFTHGNHPDFYLLQLDEEENKKTISVAAVRAMTEFLAISSHLGQHKIVLLEDTQLLNLNSANALLKSLEEPTNKSLFILLSSNLDKVIPTIISRCHKFRLAGSRNKPEQETLAATPVFNVELGTAEQDKLLQILLTPSVANIFPAATELLATKTVTFGFLVELLTKWLSDLVRYKMHGKVHYFVDQIELLKPLAVKLALNQAFYLHDRLMFLSTWSNHPLNYKLQWENLLLQYQQLFMPRKGN